jgi:hypothetical protein
MTPFAPGTAVSKAGSICSKGGALATADAAGAAVGSAARGAPEAALDGAPGVGFVEVQPAAITMMPPKIAAACRPLGIMSFPSCLVDAQRPLRSVGQEVHESVPRVPSGSRG